MKRKALIILCFILGTGLYLYGQDKEFSASAPATVQMGQQFQYKIEGSAQGSVQLPGHDAFQVLAGPFSSASSQTSWVNGKMSTKTVVSYTYIFRANRSGEFTLDPAVVVVGRKEHRTNEVTISVLDGGDATSAPRAQGAASGQEAAPEETPPMYMRVLPSKRDVYIGEQFVSGLKVYTRVNTRPSNNPKDFPYEGFYKKAVDPDPSAVRESIKGQEYITQVIQRHILIPQKTGKIVIEPHESEWIMQKRVQRQRSSSMFEDFFNDPFFNDPFESYQDVPTVIRTNPVTINVKPLPPNAPAGFTGGVGTFKVNASLSNDVVDVNEALSLKLTISGTGNIPLLGEPVVNLPPDHDIYDVNKSSNVSTSGNRISGTVSFEYPIVARHAGKFRITPITFSWFNPAKEVYETYTTEEFFFTVNKGKAEEAIGQIYVPGALGERVENIGTDIRDVIRAPAGFVPRSYSLLGKSWYWLIYGGLLILFLFVFIIFRTTIKRNADLKLVKNRKASKLAHNRLKRADKFRKEDNQDKFFEETGNAIWGYLRDKLGIDLSSLSLEKVQGTLSGRGVSDELITEMGRIIEESEFSRFAPSSEKSDMNVIYADAVSLIKNLEQKI